MACQYKDLFGRPKVGFHKQRIAGFALFDTLGTVLIALAVAHLFKLSYVKTVAVAFLLGIGFHWLFCVDTAFMLLFK